MSTPKKVVVIGAGIGGLTAALALLARGIDVEVY
jgi:phytoene dehydrogenase-like protein